MGENLRGLFAFLLHADSAAIAEITQEIYEGRRFHQLPKLAEALEAAGCTNAEILVHCRTPGEHARGCWALDLALGRT